MVYDVVIIGAGLGGLTAGAFLAKKGKKVLVLEQHFIPGGCATVFMRKGVRCEVGLHEMDWGLEKHDMKKIIFKNLGILDKIPFVQIPQAWSLKTETKEYVVPEGIENAKNYLKANFPDEKKGIDRYFRDMDITASGNSRLPSDMNLFQLFIFPIQKLPIVIRNFFEQSNTGDKLDYYFKSNALKNLLNVNCTYYSDDPYQLSWFYHASAQISYYNKAYFVKGGSQVLSDTLADVIKQNNGEIRYMSDVQKIELDGNKATGVTYKDIKTSELITVSAKKVIANCAPENVFNGSMVPQEFSEPLVTGLKPGTSLYSVYIIFNGKLSQKYPGMSYSTFIGKDKVVDGPITEYEFDFTQADIMKRPFVFVNYDAIDSGLVPENDDRSFGVFCSGSNIHEWEDLSKEDYKQKKDLLAKTLFDRLEEHFPGIKECVDYYEVSTPKTIQRYIKTPKGTAYGYENRYFGFHHIGGLTFKKARAPRRASQIKNLYFTGAWGAPGGGFTGAIISGYMAASEIILPMAVRITAFTIFATVVSTVISKYIHTLF